MQSLALFSTTDASVLPWSVYGVFPNYGTSAAIYSLTSDGTKVFGVGYSYRGGGAVSFFENSFGSDIASGAISWVNSCLGDTYSAVPVNGVLYTVGHAHDCSTIGVHPQTTPTTTQRALAESTGPAADGRVNVGGHYAGYPAPELLHWLPTLVPGSYTGQGQAAWSIAGNSQYIVLGGEFPNVNGVNQQGLTRFMINGPNMEGPQGATQLKPIVASVGSGTARLAWTSAWDRDNRNLTYEVLRGTNVASATVLKTVSAPSAWWDRPPMQFVDTTAPAGSTQTYRVRATDYYGNSVVSNLTTFTIPGGPVVNSLYANAVTNDGALDHWRLNEAAGTALANDRIGGRDLTEDSSAEHGTFGATTGDGDLATTFPGNASTPPATSTGTPLKGPDVFSVEAWINTSTTTGGKIVGFGNSPTDASTSYDRHLYMTNSGKIAFGVFPGATRTTINSPFSYNDARWHHLVGTLGGGNLTLYVDGQQVATQPGVNGAQPLYGYWRIAGDALTNWPNKPTSANINGSIDEVAVYPTALSSTQVTNHFTQATAGATNTPPTASFTSAASGQTVAFDGTGSTDSDGTVGSWVWNYGDGTTGMGSTTTHTYSTSGNYTVTLTATDNKGGAGSVANPITVANNIVFAADAFGRTVAGGLGTADAGGAWTTTGSAAGYAVGNGVGTIITAAGSTRLATLNAVSRQDVLTDLTFGIDKAQASGGSYVTVIARRVPSAGDYRVRIRYYTTGTVTAQLARLVGTTETLIGNAVTIPGATGAAGEMLRAKLLVTGNGTTTLSAKVWNTASAEPTNFQLINSDTTAALQAAGGVGVQYFVSSSVTNGPLTAMIDNLNVAPPPGANAPPTATLISAATDLAATFDGTGSADSDGTVSAYAWDYGDGSTGSGATSSHTYPGAGTYQVKLTVTDNRGIAGSITQPLTVTAPNVPPTAAFTSTSTDLTAAFDATTRVTPTAQSPPTPGTTATRPPAPPLRTPIAPVAPTRSR